MMFNYKYKFSAVAGLALLLVLALAPMAQAYVGPGAGFALLSSFLAVIIAFFTAFLALITFPVRWLFRLRRRRKVSGKSRVNRVIILGLDGLDPVITEKLMAEGELPTFAKLKETGAYRRLGTATPAMSPVAWSTFATGADASRHGIFDFLARDPGTYLPVLSSSLITGESKFMKIGPLRIPTKKSGMRFLRKSQSFWKILGDHGVYCSVLRVPITFPPEKIYGVMLAGMCVPDLRGTMGSFTYYTSSEADEKIGGTVIKLKRNGGGKNGDYFETTLAGPPSPFAKNPVALPLKITVSKIRGGARIQIGSEKFFLKEKEYSEWIRLPFKAAPGMTLNGIAKFYITRLNDDFGLYVTPIHIDPEKPAMPLSYPSFYATYLAKLLGPYATLGLAEDTWAINERVLDEKAFLEQAYGFHEERKKMWFHTLRKQRKGFITCVFDLSDRLQHLFFRYLVDDHSANKDKDTEVHRDALYDMYREMDKLLAETLEHVGKKDTLFVASDHGFKAFKMGVNLNTWLAENGFLTYKEGEQKTEYLQGVDWSKTRAYALGLGGIYINREGRERHGIVAKADCAAVKDEICKGLLAITDKEGPIINRVFDVEKDFDGPYRDQGPDLIVGFREGCRVSWDCARGLITDDVIEENEKSWSGDHCMDPDVVPGIFFSNIPVTNDHPGLIDIGPSVLDLFGVSAPRYMTGKSFIEEEK